VGTWSGIPFHLLQEGKHQGLIENGLPLRTEGSGWSMRRYLWNVLSVARGRGKGGFQYSIEFLERLWDPVRSQVMGKRLLNCFQLYPPSLVESCDDRWYFLDQTLVQLLDTYGIRGQVGSWIARDALDREREGYERAAHVVVHSEWARRSVVDDYGIAEDKVSVILPGANLDWSFYEQWNRKRGHAQTDVASPVRLVFVGKHPNRKGLDRLLRAYKIAVSDGARCTLRIIGCTPETMPAELRQIEGVQWYGFVNKALNASRYLEAVGSCDIGCLLSRSEAGGMSLREFHALGLAVIGPQVGGSPDHVIPDAARLLSPEASDREVAKAIVELVGDSELLRSMKQISRERRNEVTWKESVRQLAKLMREKP
jgi:glycosyltransferase involved in cell wall biosynthesis